VYLALEGGLLLTSLHRIRLLTRDYRAISPFWQYGLPCHRYFVSEATRQATMTGSEHRRALPFLPLCVVGVAGAPGNGDPHSALTAAICEVVVVTNVLWSAQYTNQGSGILYSEAVGLAKKAHASVIEVFQPVLGPAHTTKLHRMSAHLLDEFRLRGNVGDGNSANNEALLNAVKAAYKLTNKRRDQFVEKLVLSEHVYKLLHEEEEDDADAEEEGPGTDTGDYDSAGTRRSRPQRRQRWRRRRHAKKSSLAELAQEPQYPWLGGCAVSYR